MCAFLYLDAQQSEKGSPLLEISRVFRRAGCRYYLSLPTDTRKENRLSALYTIHSSGIQVETGRKKDSRARFSRISFTHASWTSATLYHPADLYPGSGLVNLLWSRVYNRSVESREEKEDWVSFFFFYLFFSFSFKKCSILSIGLRNFVNLATWKVQNTLTKYSWDFT